MSHDDLGPLMARVALGDRAAFSNLYREASPKLFGICIRMMKDRSEAEDALQEIFVRIWNRAATFSPERNAARAWLASVARNHCIDRLRARQPAGEPIDAAEAIADDGPSPERSVMVASDGKRIDTCLQQLDPDRADAVRLAYLDGASYQELADRFGIPLNTMRTWLRRSLLRLRECLER